MVEVDALTERFEAARPRLHAVATRILGSPAAADDAVQEAWLRLARTGALSMLRLRMGRPGPVPTPEEAESYPYSPLEREIVEGWLSNVVYGSPETVRRGLDELRERTGADELMITTNIHGGAARLHSYELIARAYKMI